jgi:CHAT domain-containing protein
LLPDFTRADLRSALDGGHIDILHLATHAVFNGRSDRAFIVANGEVVRLSELRDMIDRSSIRGEPLDLIILSACETAVGDDESSMGLAGAAVQAGARSVIGSLWQVNDAGTAELMRQFYRRYGEGGPRSEALRGAQLALIDGGGANADPNVWAAFALLGAWR